ncbi:hypothetical protein Pelo_14734 [Pelomyxa schiedti]|nr:hypothetical protein Pelo_14734 [Pelomyxa schiedti]
MEPRQFVAVVRHGDRADMNDPSWETTAEKPRDTPLTLKGHKMAEKTAALLKTLHVSCGGGPVRVLSSPFQRCLQTSAPISRALGVPVEVEPGLGEAILPAFFSSPPATEDLWFNSVTIEELAAMLGRPHDSLPADPVQLCMSHPLVERLPCGFETVGSLFARYQQVGTAVESTPGTSYVLVTHGYGVQVLTEFFSRMEAEEVLVTNTPLCCVSSFVRANSKSHWTNHLFCSDKHISD